MKKTAFNRTIILVSFMAMVCVLAYINPPDMPQIVKDVAALAAVYIAVKGKGGDSNGS